MVAEFTTPPSLDDIARIAEEALKEIPEIFRSQVTGVALRVDEFPDDETLEALDLETPYDLLGLYHGIDIGHKASGGVTTDVDMIFLYRTPLLDEWVASGVPLKNLVRHVLVHEIGHHLGLSDDDMHRIEDEPE